MTKAFSLIELLVVVAIIALLAAIAVPMYQTYSNKAKISNAMSVLFNLAEYATLQYNRTGSWQTPLTWNGVSLSNSTWNYSTGSSLQASHIYGIQYNISGTNSKIASFYAEIGGLSTFTANGTTYVDPTGNPSGNNFNANLIVVMAKDTGNGFVYQCGVDIPGSPAGAGSGNLVPMTLLPSACTCQALNNYFANGSTCVP